MRRRIRRPRNYTRRINRKYQQDPFAFLILWSLFFSAIFLVFAFRGLIASVFIPQIDITNKQPGIAGEQNTEETVENGADSPAEN
ncbi:MAG: hypothetical protein U9M89_03330 [Patescibacteria group bacterium]|nr:hypothetical protein [Patescibacteria group bacterium]